MRSLSGQGINQLMFKDKKPDYEVDETAGRLFNLDKDTLSGYRINETVETAKSEDDDDDRKDGKKDGKKDDK